MDFNFGENFSPTASISNGMQATFRGGDGVTIRDDDSADLVDVGTQIKQLRDTARKASAAHSFRLTEIANDPDLSQTGRDNARTAEESAHRASQHGLREREDQVIDGKIRELERRLDGHRGYASADLITFRDAQDRADAIDSAEAAAKVMARALRTEDRTLAHAVFRVAVEKRWTEAVRQFEAEKPETANIVNDIDKLQRLRTQFGRGFLYA